MNMLLADTITLEPETVLRRLQTPLSVFSNWSVLVPVGLAVTVMLLIVAFSRGRRLATLGWGSLAVGAFSAIYVALALTFKGMLGDNAWWVIIGPCLVVALFYIVMMYIRDCQTIHWAWAIFLGLLRCGVYGLLTVVFLLPSYEFYTMSKKGFRTIMLLDVSESMLKGKDDMPKEDEDPKTLPARQEKVLAWLMNPGEGGTVIERIVQKTPLKIYRFGGILDHEDFLYFKDLEDWNGRKPTEEQWRAFLIPEVPKEAKYEKGHVIKDALAETDPPDKVLEKPHKIHAVRLVEGRSYVIEIADASDKQEGAGFLPALRVVDSLDKQVGTSNDPGKFKRSYTVQASSPKARTDGPPAELTYHVIAAAEQGTGPYVIKILSEEANEKFQKLARRIKDLREGTSVGKAVQQAAERESGDESGEQLQAIIVVSDGQSNQEGSHQDWQVFEEKRNKASYITHVFTVGVGTYFPPVSLRVDELQGPKVVRPDDKFQIRVPVIASGLAGREFKVFLDMERLGKNEPKHTFEVIQATFKPVGDTQDETVEFPPIELKKLFEAQLKAALDALADKTDWTPEKKKQEAMSVLEGKYQFIARVPRLKGETFPKAEHESKPFIVQVQRAKPRVLLFSGGPSREYQFLRTLLFREATHDRMELTILLQTTQEGTDQDVKGEKLLTKFPGTLEKGGKAGESLADFDLIIAIDPDWTVLSGEQQKNVQTWVDQHAGGVIFVASPVHSFHLSKFGGIDVAPLQTIYPVVLKDSRIHWAPLEHDTTRPYPLSFISAAKQYEFLNLEESPTNPTSGWDKFFWDAGKPEGDKLPTPQRGFFSFYPVEDLRPDSIVIASFLGNEKSQIEASKGAKIPQPYMVLMRYGQGKTMYIGSPESWRLRQYKENAYERFWIKLIKHVAASTAMKANFGQFRMVSEYKMDRPIPLEVQIKGDNGLPLPKDQRPIVRIERPEGFNPRLDPLKDQIQLEPKPTQSGAWKGVFAASVKIRTAGKYTFSIPEVPGGGLSHEIYVHRLDLEVDNLRTDFPDLYRKASPAKLVLARLPKNPELERLFKTPPVGVEARDVRDESGRLFLRLKDADSISSCLVQEEPRTIKEKDPNFKNRFWDKGWESGLKLSLFQIVVWVMDGVGFLILAILLITRRFWSALAVLVGVWGAVHGLLWLNATLEAPSDGTVLLLQVLIIGIGALGLVALCGLVAWEKDWISLSVLLGVGLFLLGTYFGDLIQPPFVKLFDGASTAGWKSSGDWQVQGGILTGQGGGSRLVSDRDDYGNFHYRIEARINDKGRSEQFVRATPEAGRKDPIRGLGLPDAWFTQEIIARGNSISILIDGKKVREIVVDGDQIVTFVGGKEVERKAGTLPEKGHLAIELTRDAKNAPESMIEIRKIEVRELPPEWSLLAALPIPLNTNLYLALGAFLAGIVAVHVLLIWDGRWGCLATFWISKLAFVLAIFLLSWLGSALATTDNVRVVTFLAGMGGLVLLVMAEGAFAVALVLKQQWTSLAFYMGAVVLALSLWVYQGRELVMDVNFSFILMLVVGALSLEWLLRKLLRLA